ncbi:MAG: hypothetical protein LH606_01825 [Cytophagaceae bacterium]|nr:hypothetical protein [Cytophagaceae bacterium]
MKKLLIFSLLSFFALSTFAYTDGPGTAPSDTIRKKVVKTTKMQGGKAAASKKVVTKHTHKKTTKRVEG